MAHVLPSEGLTYNQFLPLAAAPMLFHCRHRKQFSNVSAAIAKILALDNLCWISLGHLEADEWGAMNEWLAASRLAEVVHGAVGCRISVNDMAGRAPRALSNGDILDLDGRRILFIDTPNVPHGWARALSLRRRPLHRFAAICSPMAGIARRRRRATSLSRPLTVLHGGGSRSART
jgi:flavorubredoxin